MTSGIRLLPTHKFAVWLIVRLFAVNVRLAPKERKSNAISINPFYAAYQADPARIALEEMESYCAAHPGSPSATRRLALSIRSGLWIALLGPSLEEGIIGIGCKVELALRAFDAQYMAGQHSPSEQIKDGELVGERVADQIAVWSAKEA